MQSQFESSIRPLQTNFLFLVHRPHLQAGSRCGPRNSFNDVTDPVYVRYVTRFQGKCMTDMLLSVMIYDLCCSKTQPWTIFELGDDRMSFRELIIASWWAFYFNEVPVKVQISCNLEPCCLKKLIIKSARLHA